MWLYLLSVFEVEQTWRKSLTLMVKVSFSKSSAEFEDSRFRFLELNSGEVSEVGGVRTPAEDL